jgi:hypothetical protein
VKNLFLPLSKEIKTALDSLPARLDSLFPLPAKYKRNLPSDVAELSGLLTSERGSRRQDYLGEKRFLSAYLRYFLSWNLYRLCRLLPGLPLRLKDGDCIDDLGTGPLTLVLALWICRPELRGLKLTFRCVDRNGPVLDAGRKLFYSLQQADSRGDAWTVHCIKGPLNTPLRGGRAALVAALNVFNESYMNGHYREGLQESALSAAGLLQRHLDREGQVLLVEPGVPRAGEFLSLLRAFMLEKGWPEMQALSPCTHSGECCMRSQGKWCNFKFVPEDANKDLQKLSRAAGLEKKRTGLSFLLLGPGKEENSTLRIVSDIIKLPDNKQGFYACSKAGLILVYGEKEKLNGLASGSLLELPPSFYEGRTEKDQKSGARLFRL